MHPTGSPSTGSRQILRPGGTLYVKEIFRERDPLTEPQRLSVQHSTSSGRAGFQP